MDPNKSSKLPAGIDRHLMRWPLYTRLGFGLIVLFGTVGNCAGHREGSAMVFVLVAVVWTCLRIIQEALVSWHVLKMLNEFEEAAKKHTAEPPPPPPDSEA